MPPCMRIAYRALHILMHACMRPGGAPLREVHDGRPLDDQPARDDAIPRVRTLRAQRRVAPLAAPPEAALRIGRAGWATRGELCMSVARRARGRGTSGSGFRGSPLPVGVRRRGPARAGRGAGRGAGAIRTSDLRS